MSWFGPRRARSLPELVIAVDRALPAANRPPADSLISVVSLASASAWAALASKPDVTRVSLPVVAGCAFNVPAGRSSARAATDESAIHARKQAAMARGRCFTMHLWVVVGRAFIGAP